MMYEAILFDMDGVLVDTRLSVIECWTDIADFYQIHLTESDFVNHIYGCPAVHIFDTFFNHLHTNEYQNILAKIAEYETQMIYSEIRGATNLLRELKKSNVPTALVTSGEKWKVAEVIRQLKLDSFFVEQITSDDVERGKPHPECYVKAACSLQKLPEQCIVFEDSVSGVKAATNAGSICIGINQSDMANQLLQAGAHLVIPNLDLISINDSGIEKTETQAMDLQVKIKNIVLSIKKSDEFTMYESH
jgi:HAD superfamily hydrolase (TIGR01509 family)